MNEAERKTKAIEREKMNYELRPREKINMHGLAK